MTEKVVGNRPYFTIEERYSVCDNICFESLCVLLRVSVCCYIDFAYIMLNKLVFDVGLF